ncbi:H-NS family nucleoid-associated regulatory protein [Shewanella xiamenensis]|uniref:H-NS family nucleoid-associated regulatory protein n=1 Tax=Shewanella xiamenensis TaxID=332186 RepID=A0AAE4TRB2_9GAMM|nr:H-NS family nucleoid-associated regulatory protein [Shewanella xiamenensis]MDV5393114.1 H-NS family nucleoid-associated regulatory protein [Shewanella xiamenensis]
MRGSFSIKRERQPKPPKYAITVDGEQVTWTGQGRMPKPIKAAIDNGASLESFLIK